MGLGTFLPILLLKVEKLPKALGAINYLNTNLFHAINHMEALYNIDMFCNKRSRPYFTLGDQYTYNCSIDSLQPCSTSMITEGPDV